LPDGSGEFCIDPVERVIQFIEAGPAATSGLIR